MIPLYREKDTFYSRLHPISSLLLTFSLMTVALVVSNPVYLAAVFSCLIMLVASAELFRPWRYFARISLWLGIAVVIINPLVSREGTHIIWRGPTIPVLGQLNITLEASCYGLGMAFRLAIIVGAFGFLTLVLDPDRMLGLFSWRNSRSALVTSLSLRMVPTMARDSHELLDAQRSRGIVRDEGGTWEKLRSRLPLLRGLLITSLERSVGMAEAMESRAFGSGCRTRLVRWKWGAGDWLIAICSLTILGLGVASAVTGSGSYSYYPTLTSPLSGGLLWPVLGMVAVFALFTIMELGWKKWLWLRLRI